MSWFYDRVTYTQMALLSCDSSLHCNLERKKESQKHKAKARSCQGEQWERFTSQRQKHVNEKSAKGWLLTNIVKLVEHQCKHEPRCMANHADAIHEITTFTIQFLLGPNCVFASANIGTSVYLACSVCFHLPATHETVGMLCAASFSDRRWWQTTLWRRL